ncbi:MAG: glutathione S-transferase family protein [Paracoccaceae bacterium]
MKLFHSKTSPYVRKVDLFLHLAAQSDAVTRIEGSGTAVAPNAGTVAANPLGKVPCLVTEEGLGLFDSRVITRYLDARFRLGLYPEGDALWPVLAREALADGILDAALLVIYESRLRPEEARFAPWVEGQRAKIAAGLARLEAEAPGFDGLGDASLIAAACVCGYLDLRFAEMGWRDGHPALAHWYASVADRPEMAATHPG